MTNIEWVPAVSTLVGALAMMVWRSVKSIQAGESFDPTKFLRTLGVVAALMGGESWAAYGDALSVQGPGIIYVVIASFAAGWGAVLGTSEAVKVWKKE